MNKILYKTNLPLFVYVVVCFVVNSYSDNLDIPLNF